jgi:AmmeMemoRadiSam system protein B
VKVFWISLASFLLLAGSAQPAEPETFAIPPGGGALHTVFEGLYAASKLPSTGKTPRIPALILPHHLTAAATIAAGVQALVPERPRSILLVSPDHVHACPALLCAGNIGFETPFGTVAPDPTVLEALRSSALVSDRPDLFHREHGISSVLPFIARQLPGARVTPLIMAIRPDWKARGEDLVALIKRATDRNVTLVISSDFSHYLPLQQADAKDEVTAQAIMAKDFRGIGALDDPSQSDCPPCLWLAARIADERNAYNPSVLLHTNSARLLNDERATSTTSHFAIAFYENARLSPQDIALAGDVTLTRTKAGATPAIPEYVRDFWAGAGPRIVNLEGPLLGECPLSRNSYVFCNPLSLWLALGPLATHWSLENNHKLDHGMAGYAESRRLLEEERETVLDDSGAVRAAGMRMFALTNVMNPVAGASRADIPDQYRRVIAALRTGREEGMAQIVYVHAGSEYRALPSAVEQRYLRSFVEAGADAVAGVHSHVPGGMEMYRGAPIFYGLGNFIFDQNDSIPTMTATVVRLRPTPNGILFETRVGKGREGPALRVFLEQNAHYPGIVSEGPAVSRLPMPTVWERPGSGLRADQNRPGRR